MLESVVTRAHGGGGEESRDLVRNIFLTRLGNPILDRLDDFGLVSMGTGRIALTTDSFVVNPWDFPGGNIGDLAICGTVNDLCMAGATPLYLTAGFILPEGFPLRCLEQVVDAMAERAHEAGVQIVAGDTKVVEAGMGPFINTAGVGLVPEGVCVGGAGARAGDVVLVSGDVGRHGVAVLSRREGIEFGTMVTSDVAPLNRLVGKLVQAGVDLHVLRDPTRGGIAGVLNEIAVQSSVEIEIEEEGIPVVAGVRSACKLMGFDTLHVASEGCALVIVPQKAVDESLRLMRAEQYGTGAVQIGVVRAGPPRVIARTVLGGRRLVDAPSGELLPRIC